MTSPPRQPPDAQLWAQGSADAFGDLYGRHARAVQAFCLRRTADPALAEDLTSTVFLEAWRGRARVGITTPTARPYLLGIATNVLRQQWRVQRRHRAAVEALAGRVGPPHHGDDEAIDRVDALAELARIRDLVDRLPRRDREVLALVAWGELTYGETAAALGVPVGTVRSRLNRARARLAAGDDRAVLPIALTTNEGCAT